MKEGTNVTHVWFCIECNDLLIIKHRLRNPIWTVITAMIAINRVTICEDFLQTENKKEYASNVIN